MDINEKNSVENVNEEDFSEVAGGRKVNFFGMASETGSYSKCDLCGEYGTVPLSNGVDVCLRCLGKKKNLIGQDNTFRLLAINTDIPKEVLAPSAPASNDKTTTEKKTN